MPTVLPNCSMQEHKARAQSLHLGESFIWSIYSQIPAMLRHVSNIFLLHIFNILWLPCLAVAADVEHVPAAVFHNSVQLHGSVVRMRPGPLVPLQHGLYQGRI